MTRKIGGTWHLYRRVPKDYAQVEGRAFVRQSLKTVSEIEAQEKARTVWDELVVDRPSFLLIRNGARVATQRGDPGAEKLDIWY